MAGNDAIQFLRGTSAQRATHTELSLEGQPIFETDTNKLYIGDGTTTVANLTSIRVADADHATTADSATNATNAQHATTADSATKATQDSDGNTIEDTYAKQTGTYPSMTVGNATNAQNATNATYAVGNNARTLDERLASLENLKTLTVVKTASEWSEQNPVLLPGQFGYDTTNKVTKIGDGTTAWANLYVFLTMQTPTFANSDWATIAEVSKNGQAQSFFSVGDERTIELTTGEQVTLVILGFNHDDLTGGGGKAGISIGMKNLLSGRYGMDSISTGKYSWDDSEMRKSTMATLLSQLQPDLQNVIKQVNKKTASANNSSNIITTADKLWLFSKVEIDGTTLFREGEQYEYWKTVKDGTVDADRIKYLSNGNGGAYNWWLRTSYVGDSVTINSGGRLEKNSPIYDFGVSFGFCV